jgi:Tfp pilus assembly protein PilN
MAQTLAARIAALGFLQVFWVQVEPLFRPGLPRRTAPVVPVATLPATEDDIRHLAAVAGPVRAALSAEACLERRIALPRAARAEAAGAIALHLRTSLPQGGRGLIWRAVPAGEEGDRLQWRVLIVKEAQLADLAIRARSAGARLSEIGLARLDLPPLWEADPRPPYATRNWATATVLAVALVALVAVVATGLQARQMEALADARESRVAELRDRLVQARARGAEAADRQQAFAAQWALYAGGARPLAALAGIADALPPDVWLSELAMTAGEWRLSGFTSGDVSATVTALQALPFALNVRLEGPVSHDSFSNQNRFDLVLTATAGTTP